MARTAERYAGGLQESLSELAALELVQKATVEIRVHRSAPLFKIYLINESDLFFGFYPVKEHKASIDGETILVNDPKGKDAILFYHASDGNPDSMGGQYISEALRWFDSIWTTMARPYQP